MKGPRGTYAQIEFMRTGMGKPWTARVVADDGTLVGAFPLPWLGRLDAQIMLELVNVIRYTVAQLLPF